MRELDVTFERAKNIDAMHMGQIAVYLFELRELIKDVQKEIDYVEVVEKRISKKIR